MSDWALNAILRLKERQIDKLVIPLKLGGDKCRCVGLIQVDKSLIK